MLRPEPPQVSLSLFSHGMDLDATLTSGQSFSWKRTSDGKWRGWIDGHPCLVWSQGDALRAVGPELTRDAVSRYFGLDLPIEEIFVWLGVTYATAIVYEIVRRWKSSGKRATHAFLG